MSNLIPSPQKAETKAIAKLIDLRKVMAKPFKAEEYALTEKEQAVAEYAAYGLTNPEIAEKLSLPETTVVNDLHRAKQKLGVSKSGLTVLLVRELAAILEVDLGI